MLVGDGLYMQAKAKLAQVLLDRAFAAAIVAGGPVKAWSWADTWPVARIEITRIGARAIVLEGASGEALAFGPAHVAGTPRPGEPGTAVYAAHRDTHFDFLKDVVAGDDIAVTRADGARFDFRIVATRVARFDNSDIDAHAPGRRLVLSTCWPLDAKTPGPMRYLVEAELIEPGR